MPEYKGYNPLGPGDLKPWGARDLQHEKDVIDSIVMDCISATKDLTGHKHRSLYDGYGQQTVSTNDSTKLITVGKSDYSHRIEMNVQTDSSAAMRMRSGGYSFMQYDSLARTIRMGEVGGHHKVIIQLGYGNPSFDIKKWNSISALRIMDGSNYLAMDNDVRIGGQSPDASGDNITQFMSIDRTQNYKQFIVQQWGRVTASGAVVPGLTNYSKPKCLYMVANSQFDQMLFACHPGDHNNPMWMGFLVGDNYGKTSPQLEIARDSVLLNSTVNIDGSPVKGAGWFSVRTSSPLSGTPDAGEVWIWVDNATGYLIKVKDSTGAVRTLSYA